MLELNANMGMKGYFPEISAFQGTSVALKDPLRPDLDDEGPLQVLEHPGTRRILSKQEGPDELPNKLLTAGLNQMANRSDWMNYCNVGSGGDTPVAGDTALQSWVAGTATIFEDIWGARPSRPYYGWRRKTYRFAEGDAAGNLQEIGIGWDDIAGANLIARHKTVNALNQETSITVLAMNISTLPTSSATTRPSRT